MKTKALIRLVESEGGKFLRSKGSHKIYRMPNGEIVNIPLSGAHTEASPGIEHKAKRAIRRNLHGPVQGGKENPSRS